MIFTHLALAALVVSVVFAIVAEKRRQRHEDRRIGGAR
jgi:hypothetical protein